MPDRDYDQEAHDQGEKDGAENNYNNPFTGSLGGLFGTVDPERAEKYDEGFKNGRDNPSKK